MKEADLREKMRRAFRAGRETLRNVPILELDFADDAFLRWYQVYRLQTGRDVRLTKRTNVNHYGCRPSGAICLEHEKPLTTKTKMCCAEGRKA
jgi:hypothetical protein